MGACRVGDAVTVLWDTARRAVSVWDTGGNLVWGEGGEPVEPTPSTPFGLQLDAAMPRSYMMTLDVRADGTGDYTTISAATEAVQSHRRTLDGNGGRTGWATPYQWALIRVWPGEYQEYRITRSSMVHVVGMGERPEDVHVWSADSEATDRTDPAGMRSSTGGGNIAQLHAQSQILENMHLDHQHWDPGWHAVWCSAGSGTVGLKDYAFDTSILRRCRLTSVSDGLAGKCAADITIGSHTLIFDECWFDAPGQPQAVNGIIGYADPFHGMPSRIVYNHCSVTAAYEWHEDPTLPNNGRQFANGLPAPASPMGMPDSGRSLGDEAWWIDGGSWDLGPHETGFRAAITIAKYGNGAAKHHIDPSVPSPPPESPSLPERENGPVAVVATGNGLDWQEVGMEPITSAGGVVDRVVPEVVPLGLSSGVCANARAFYGADPAVVPAPPILASPGTGMAATVPAGTYLMRVPAAEVAVMVGAVDVDLAGSGTMRLGTAYQEPAEGTPTPYRTASGQVWTSGATAIASGHSPVIRRWLMPGHGHLWLGITLTSEATGRGALRTSAEPVYYSPDGTWETAEPLPLGQPYPLLHAVTA